MSNSSHPCFLAPIPLKSAPSSTIRGKCDTLNRSAPSAILEKISRAKPVDKTASRTASRHKRHPSHQSVDADLPVGVSPINYRVYPDGFTAALPPPPIHYTIPVLGYAIELLAFCIFPRERARKLGDIYTSSGFLGRMHVIADRTAIVELSKDSDTFICKNASPAIVASAGEKFLLNLDGKEHQEVLRKLTPAFSPKLFSFYTDRLRGRAETAWKNIAQETATPGKKVALEDMINELFFVGILEIANGTGMKQSEYTKIRCLWHDFVGLIFAPEFMPRFKRGIEARKEILLIVEDIIRRMLVDDADIINELREYGDAIDSKGSRDILKGRVSIAHIWAAKTDFNVGPYAENDPELITEQAEMSLSLWFAGTTSSASTTMSALFEMGSDTNIWNRLAKEQDRIVENTGGDREIRYQQTKDMVLLDSFINEITRLHPVFPNTVRIAARDCEVFGRKIEKNSIVSFDWFAANMDERYYAEPEKLNMDRFLPKTGSLVEPYPLSFGAKGTAHYCMGASLTKLIMKTTLSILLREYTMDMDENQSRKYSILPNHQPESGVLITALKARF